MEQQEEAARWDADGAWPRAGPVLAARAMASPILTPAVLAAVGVGL